MNFGIWVVNDCQRKSQERQQECGKKGDHRIQEILRKGRKKKERKAGKRKRKPEIVRRGREGRKPSQSPNSFSMQ